MTHVDEGRLQAFLDGQLGGEDLAVVAAHVETCAVCAAAVDALRAAAAMLAGALRVLDVPAPVAAAREAIFRRRAAERALVVRRGLLRAAALVVGFAAVGTAALPQSPVRVWVGDVWERAAERFAEDPAEAALAAAPADAAQPANPEPESSGVSILPADGRVRILIEGAAPETRLRVRLVAGDRVAVHASGAAADARFHTGQDRVEVVGAGPGELRVELPYALRNATVEVDGRVYAVKSGAELRSMIGGGAGVDLLLPLRPPEPDR